MTSISINDTIYLRYNNNIIEYSDANFSNSTQITGN